VTERGMTKSRTRASIEAELSKLLRDSFNKHAKNILREYGIKYDLMNEKLYLHAYKTSSQFLDDLRAVLNEAIGICEQKREFYNLVGKDINEMFETVYEEVETSLSHHNSEIIRLENEIQSQNSNEKRKEDTKPSAVNSKKKQQKKKKKKLIESSSQENESNKRKYNTFQNNLQKNEETDNSRNESNSKKRKLEKNLEESNLDNNLQHVNGNVKENEMLLEQSVTAQNATKTSKKQNNSKKSKILTEKQVKSDEVENETEEIANFITPVISRSKTKTRKRKKNTKSKLQESTSELHTSNKNDTKENISILSSNSQTNLENIQPRASARIQNILLNNTEFVELSEIPDYEEPAPMVVVNNNSQESSRKSILKSPENRLSDGNSSSQKKEIRNVRFTDDTLDIEQSISCPFPNCSRRFSKYQIRIHLERHVKDDPNFREMRSKYLDDINEQEKQLIEKRRLSEERKNLESKPSTSSSNLSSIEETEKPSEKEETTISNSISEKKDKKDKSKIKKQKKFRKRAVKNKKNK
jgi:hypothetical protein